MDENKVIRPMDFVRLTNIDESNVIKDTKNHIGLVKEVSRDGRMSIIWIGETYSQLAWFKSSELEAVIREIVPGMPEVSVRHAAECMCTDRMGSMMDIDLYILREENRPYKCHYLKDLLEDRVARINKMHEDKSYTYDIDDNYWCATCGSHSHKEDSKTGYCWHCDTDSWVKEDGADVGI